MGFTHSHLFLTDLNLATKSFEKKEDISHPSLVFFPASNFLWLAPTSEACERVSPTHATQRSCSSHDGRFFIQNSRSYLFQQKLIPTRHKIKAFLPVLFCSTQTVCMCVHTPCTVCNVFLILAVTNLKSWLLHCFPNFLLCLNNDFASHCCCLPLFQDASFRKAIFATKVFKEQWPLKSTPRNSTVKEEKTQKSSSEGLQEGF